MVEVSAPFGIRMHTAVSELGGCESIGEGVFVVDPPRPHPALTGYVVRATARLGVVWIKGLGDEIDFDAYGNASRSRCDELVSQLSLRYGPGEHADFLMHDSIWNEDRDWQTGVAQGERVYSTEWTRPSVNLPPDLESVYAGVCGAGPGTTRIVIEYASLRLEEAQAEINEQLSDLL